MQVWMVGDGDRSLSVWLERYLDTEVQSGHPDGPGEHIVIVSGVPVRDEDIGAARAVILIEPQQAEQDRVTRLLAAKHQTRLHIITDVADRIRAERTWSLLLALAARVPQAIDRMRTAPVSQSEVSGLDAPEFSLANEDRPVDLYGRTVGFVGFGPMGWRVAELASQLGMRPVYWPEPGTEEFAVEREGAALRSGAAMVRFDHLLANADVVVLDVPLSEGSVRLIDSPELASMREDAFLVNSAHGRAIDEGALIQALRDGRLAGVALDRFNYEPLPVDSPLRGFERVLLTPGIAAPTREETAKRTAFEVTTLLGQTSDGQSTGRRVRHIVRRRAR